MRIDGSNASAVGPGIGEVRAAEMDSSPALAAAKVKIGRHVLEAFTTANIKPPGPQDVHDSLSEAVDLTATRKLGRLPGGFIGQGHIQAGKLGVPPVKGREGLNRGDNAERGEVSRRHPGVEVPRMATS